MSDSTITSDGEPDNLEAAAADDQLEHDVPTDAEPDSDDTGRAGNPEAAKWRKQFRVKEVELTVANATIEQMRRERIQDWAAEVLADPADIWREPVDLAEFDNDLGTPDRSKVHEYAETLIASHPHWRRRGPATPAASTVTSDQSPYDSAPQTNWSRLLKGGAGG